MWHAYMLDELSEFKASEVITVRANNIFRKCTGQLENDLASAAKGLRRRQLLDAELLRIPTHDLQLGIREYCTRECTQQVRQTLLP